MENPKNTFTQIYANGVNHAVFTTDNSTLLEMQNYICQPIKKISMEGETQINPYAFSSISLNGQGMVFNGEIFSNTKGEMLNFFPEYLELVRMVRDPSVLTFVIIAGEVCNNPCHDEWN